MVRGRVQFWGRILRTAACAWLMGGVAPIH